MESNAHLIEILLTLLVMISGFTAGLIAYFARKMDGKLEKNDQEHNGYNIRLAQGDEKLKKVDQHDQRLDEHDKLLDEHGNEIKSIKTKLRYKIIE
jgi:competence protein ComGF